MVDYPRSGARSRFILVFSRNLNVFAFTLKSNHRESRLHVKITNERISDNTIKHKSWKRLEML